ncbi:MAG TPA: flagellar export protein FliJ, partial [Alcanivorax sp.]|nr:flagellar export protein FliJ [Alcanivorax sp.]
QAQSAAQLDALRRYRHEYCRRLQDAMSRGIDAATLANYRRFIRSLDDAIDKALQALDQQQEKVAASQQHWQQRQRQLSSYDTLAARRAEQERRQEQRRELRDNDELTNNAMARRVRRD